MSTYNMIAYYPSTYYEVGNRVRCTCHDSNRVLRGTIIAVTRTKEPFPAPLVTIQWDGIPGTFGPYAPQDPRLEPCVENKTFEEVE